MTAEAAEELATAPDAVAIIRLLTERLYDTGDDMPEIKPNGSILMLMNRFSPALRQQVFNFIRTCIHEDLINMKVLVLKRAAEPNRFLAMVRTIDTIRSINRGVSATAPSNAASDLLSVYAELWMLEQDAELSEEALNEIVSVHLARAIHAGFAFGVELADELPANPDFFNDIEQKVPALTALMGTFDLTNDESKVPAAIELAAYVRERLSEASRIAAFIRSHKVFDRSFMDDLLADRFTPIEEGRL